MTCSVDGCERPVRARGWCFPHYKRWRRHGDPVGGRSTAPGEPWSWLVGAVVTASVNCINWPYGTGGGGYGVVTVPGVGQVPAHRAAWALDQGDVHRALQVAGGHVVDHLCHNEALRSGTCRHSSRCDHLRCVNPRHLSLTNTGENVRRAFR